MSSAVGCANAGSAARPQPHAGPAADARAGSGGNAHGHRAAGSCAHLTPGARALPSASASDRHPAIGSSGAPATKNCDHAVTDADARQPCLAGRLDDADDDAAQRRRAELGIAGMRRACR